MNKTYTLDIVSAEEKIFSGAVRFAVFPGVDGELGVYPHHTPLLSMIREGTIKYQKENNDDFEILYVSGGILEIQSNIVTVLADTAVRGADLDEAKAEKAIISAREKIKNQGDKIDFAKAQGELAEATAQMETLRKIRKNKIAHN